MHRYFFPRLKRPHSCILGESRKNPSSAHIRSLRSCRQRGRKREFMQRQTPPVHFLSFCRSGRIFLNEEGGESICCVHKFKDERGKVHFLCMMATSSLAIAAIRSYDTSYDKVVKKRPQPSPSFPTHNEAQVKFFSKLCFEAAITNVVWFWF